MEPVGQQARSNVHDIMVDISYTLVEPMVNTTLGDAVVSGPARVVHPPDMRHIYAGCQLIVGSGEARELITVATTTDTSLTADFSQPHAASEVIWGATFSTGYPEKQAFTQEEILSYIADAQNEFLLAVRPVYSTAMLELRAGVPIYDQPADSIRVERIALNRMPLWNTSRRDLDMTAINWPSNPGYPRYWLGDEIGTAKIGIAPTPVGGYLADTWYSQRDSGILAMDQDLLVPMVFAHYVKYGALSHAFEKDGEMRDPDRAKYCGKRFDLGVSLAQKFMGHAKIPTPKGAAMAKFSPMVMSGDQNG